MVNLIQAHYMEIMSDEAYYGLFGKYFDWGYYDHPPMVALLVKISSMIFSGNLGIRFMTVLLQLATLLVVWKLIENKNDDKKSVISFFIISASITLFSAYGFLTAPDSPLLFFTALFLLAYKRFLKNSGFLSVIFLAVSMAAMVYSKYQAILFIAFTVIANIRLLKSYRFWLSGILALVLLIPHINWQITNNFPSLQYHLIDRSESFRPGFLLEYLPNQLAVFNPFTLGALIYAIIKYKPSDIFQKNLYFQVAGFIGFFFLMSFRGHVEPHWTIACSIPMIIILTEKCSVDTRLFRFTRRFILPSLILLVFVRLIILTDIAFVRNLAFGGKEQEYNDLEAEAGDLPLVFSGAFQRPSLYTFFTGKEAMAVSSLYSRQTQYDIWQFEKKYHNKPAFICINPLGNSKIYVSDTIGFGGYRTDSLQTVNRIRILFGETKTTLQPGEKIKLDFEMINPYEYDIDFNHGCFPAELCAVLLKGREVHLFKVFPDEPLSIIESGKTIKGTFTWLVPDLPENTYGFGLSLNTDFGPSLNSRFIKIKIRKGI